MCEWIVVVVVFFSVQLSVSLLSSTFCMILCLILLVTFIIIVACISIEKILRTKTAVAIAMHHMARCSQLNIMNECPSLFFFCSLLLCLSVGDLILMMSKKKTNCHSVWFRCALSEITHHPENSKTNNMARTIKLSYATFEGTFGIFHNKLTRLTKLSWYLIAIQKKNRKCIGDRVLRSACSFDRCAGVALTPSHQ